MSHLFQQFETWLASMGLTPIVLLVTAGVALLVFLNVAIGRTSLRQPGP